MARSRAPGRYLIYMYVYIVYVCVVLVWCRCYKHICVCLVLCGWLVGMEERGGEGEGVDYDDTHKIYLYIYDNI